MSAYSIGEAARMTGIKVPTIRYYESIGLLPAPQRQANNRRLYDNDQIGRLAFIRHARALGFEIADIEALLSLRNNPAQSCSKADTIARARLSDVEDRIRSLTTLRDELTQMIQGCRQHNVGDCHVIEVIADRSCTCH